MISPSPALCNNTDGDWLSVLSAAVLEVLRRNKFLIILLLTLSWQEPWKPTLLSKCVLKCFCLAWNGQTAHNDKIRPPSWIFSHEQSVETAGLDNSHRRRHFLICWWHPYLERTSLKQPRHICWDSLLTMAEGDLNIDSIISRLLEGENPSWWYSLVFFSTIANDPSLSLSSRKTRKECAVSRIWSPGTLLEIERNISQSTYPTGVRGSLENMW